MVPESPQTRSWATLARDLTVLALAALVAVLSFSIS
jgi:hypothetical protein